MTHTIDLQAINRGLGTLASLMQVPEVRTTVAAFHADFTAASQQIDVLGDYKDVHDNLHQLQFLCYNSIVTQSGRFPGDADAVDIITDHEITFQGIVVRLQEVATRPALSGDEMTWIQDLVQAQGYLRQAIETLDPVSLKRCCLVVRRVLDRYPSLINTRLNSAARTLRMEAIVQAMTEIQQVMRGLDLKPAEAQAFELSVSSLADLNRRLTALVRDHDRWQDVDVQFRGIEAGIDRDLEILEMSWSDLQARIAPLAADESQDWVQNLRRSAVALDGGLTSHDPVKIRSSFSRYRRVAGERFFQVDTELKDLCGQLRDMGTPLAVVAQIIAAGKSQPSPAEEARPAAGASRPADNRVRLEGQLAEQDRQYKALTDKIAALDQDIGRTLDSEQKLTLKQRRDAREAERSAVSKKMSEIETQLASLADR